jgi:FSR family fosmidomycin resistance protein-like MFS transporter
MAPIALAPDAPVVLPARSRYGNLALHSAAHFFIDVYSGALGAFQPFLVASLGLTLTQAGWLGGMFVFSSSVTQPLYGHLSDRYRSKLFTALAPAAAGLFISALGVAPSYPWLILLILLGGAGIASFHPQGSARATHGITRNHGRWMAVFISSGTLGLALGPTFFTAVIRALGLPGALWAAIPGVLMSAVLLFFLSDPPDHQTTGPTRAGAFDLAPLLAVWRPLALLYFLVFIRSILQVTFAQFLPLFLHRERGYTHEHASWTLTTYLTAGALGGFVGGNLADRFGGRRVNLASMVGALPFLALFFWGPAPLQLLGLILGGLILLFTIPVNVVMAQRLVSGQTGTVSSLMMGFAWGMAGFLFIPLTGWLADHTSLHFALSALLAFPVIGVLLSLMLREDAAPCR